MVYHGESPCNFDECIISLLLIGKPQCGPLNCITTTIPIPKGKVQGDSPAGRSDHRKSYKVTVAPVIGILWLHHPRIDVMAPEEGREGTRAGHTFAMINMYSRAHQHWRLDNT